MPLTFQYHYHKPPTVPTWPPPVGKPGSKWSRSLTMSHSSRFSHVISVHLIHLFISNGFLVPMSQSTMCWLRTKSTSCQKAPMPEKRNNKRTKSARKGQKLDARTLVHGVLTCYYYHSCSHTKHFIVSVCPWLSCINEFVWKCLSKQKLNYARYFRRAEHGTGSCNGWVR